MSRFYSKPALTLTQQVALLQSRGMAFADSQQAEFYLSQINYYRLGAYWLLFEADHANHVFEPGTTFEQVLEHYVFDRELRLLLLDATERIEVAVRTRWAYEMAHHHGPHSHMESSLAKNFVAWAQNIASLDREVSRSDEIFIQHYRREYTKPELPPVWAVCEVMSLGLLSRWYTQLGPMKTRKAIADHFGFDQQTFEGILEHLTYVRNICAHHSRLWNRHFTKTIPLPKNKPPGLRAQLNADEDRSVYNTLVVLLHLMDVISPQHHWRKRLNELLTSHQSVSVMAMGFPTHYQEFPIWQEAA